MEPSLKKKLWDQVEKTEQQIEVDRVLSGYRKVSYVFIMSNLQTDLGSRGLVLTRDQCGKLLDVLVAGGKVRRLSMSLYRVA